MMKRKIAILLMVCMTFTMMPGMAFANTSDAPRPAKALKAKEHIMTAAEQNELQKVRTAANDFVDAAKAEIPVYQSVEADVQKDVELPKVDEAYTDAYKGVNKVKSGKKTASGEYVAVLGDYMYSTLQYAISEAADGDEIYLIDDADGAVITEKDISLDLNGYNIGGAYSDGMLFIYDSDVTVYNSDKDYVSAIINVGYGDGLIALGSSDVYVENVGFMTSADESFGFSAGEGTTALLNYCTFLNGSILDDYSSDAVGVFTSLGAVVGVENSTFVFDEGVLMLSGGGYLESQDNIMVNAEGIGIFNSGGDIFTDGDNNLAGNPFVNYEGWAEIRTGLFESTYEDVPAIDSGYSNNGGNIEITSGSVVSPSNWKTVDKDMISVYRNMAKPSNLKVNLSGSNSKIKATWSSVSGASGYAVYYKKGTGSYKYWGRTTSKSATIKNLSSGYKYTVKVVPYKKAVGEYGTIYGQGTKYSTAYTYTLKKVTLDSVSKSNGKVKVKWKNISGESGYQISKSTKSSGTNIVATVKTTTGTSKLITATKGKTYYYKVRAYKTVDGKKIYGTWSSPKKYKRT